MTILATSPGAASDHDGRRPFAVRPKSVNWLTNNTGAPISDTLRSSGRIRNSAIFRTIVCHASGASSRPIPTRANTPLVIDPTTSSSTVTLASDTRVNTAFMTITSP